LFYLPVIADDETKTVPEKNEKLLAIGEAIGNEESDLDQEAQRLLIGFPDILPDDFKKLIEIRQKLLALTFKSENELQRLNDERSFLPDGNRVIDQRIEAKKNDVTKYKSEIEKLEAKKTENSLSHEESLRLDNFKRWALEGEQTIASYINDKGRIEWLDRRISRLTNDLKILNNYQNNIELLIADKLDIEEERNEFRKLISLIFCGLVGCVIIGFYFIAFKKEDIASSIFSGEKGIQFVTIFLIVIAVILFGIMGILEGKELSALLGGLSGYILGRVSRQP
jgi:hypothetical protein